MSQIITKVTLPSKGLLNVGSPEYAQEISMDMIGYEESKFIYGSSGDNLIDDLLNKLIIEPKLDLDNLTTPDKMFLLIKQRIHSYGSIYHLPGVCPYCDKASEFEIDIDKDVEIIELDDEFVNPIRIELPFCGKTVGVRVLKEGDIKKINKQAREKEEKLKIPFGITKYQLKLIKSVAEIDGVEVDFKAASDFVSDLKGRDLAMLKHTAESVDFGYSNKVAVKCSCGQSFDVPFVVHGEFFRPRFD